jgi:putative AdoMet-dependent methyltransferase
MSNLPGWYYDETRHAGVDYGDPAQVEVYDRRHCKFRDYRKGAEEILLALDLQPGQTVIDMGAGTGAFALHAAPRCRTVFAVDVSRAMLECARRNAEALGIANISFHRGGFLTYEHGSRPADAVVSVMALHHLPDFWKLIGLRRIAGMLGAAGRFYLSDVVFPSGVADYAPVIDGWVAAFAQAVGPEFVPEVETHVRDEYSTFDWAMEGLLEHAGFQIESARYADGFTAVYLCTKARERSDAP